MVLNDYIRRIVVDLVRFFIIGFDYFFFTDPFCLCFAVLILFFDDHGRRIIVHRDLRPRAQISANPAFNTLDLVSQVPVRVPGKLEQPTRARNTVTADPFVINASAGGNLKIIIGDPKADVVHLRKIIVSGCHRDVILAVNAWCRLRQTFQCVQGAPQPHDLSGLDVGMAEEHPRRCFGCFDGKQIVVFPHQSLIFLIEFRQVVVSRGTQHFAIQFFKHIGAHVFFVRQRILVDPADSCIGLPLPGSEIAIKDDDGNSMPQGESGEICIRGPNVMPGYYNQPEENAKAFTPDGFMRTGDIGIMDAEGYTRIIDRKKDMILVSGFNVFPNEIENVISTCPGVLECAAVGIPDEKSGEAVKVFVVRSDPSLEESDVERFCHENLTGYKRPKYIEFREDLPKTNVGKILRRELRTTP